MGGVKQTLRSLYLLAGTAVIGKVRLVTATGDEITNDTLDSIVASQATHDNLNANANLQVANADVAAANPVPIEGPDLSGAAITGNPVLAMNLTALLTVVLCGTGTYMLARRVGVGRAGAG